MPIGGGLVSFYHFLAPNRGIGPTHYSPLTLSYIPARHPVGDLPFWLPGHQTLSLHRPHAPTTTCLNWNSPPWGV